ncbi:MAG: radical SAM family heme chaperone HemW [Clostridia bacterium]|nr:radical SAM family heme chaperone HemW [Clostridia bacterium]
MEGLYIHVPFCKSKCNYCDFYSKPVNGDGLCLDIKNYSLALKKHIRNLSHLLKKYTFDTIYFGGGTPSILGEELALIFEEIKNNFNIAKNYEATFEANPESITPSLAKSCFEAGFNRVSVGLQSAIDKELSLLGRIHTKKDFEKGLDILKSEGFSDISADIMLGIPNQTMKTLKETLDFILSLDLTHISAYGLKIEEGTPFYKNLDPLSLANEKEQAEFYLATVEKLQKGGFNQYEISNFAKEGFISRHNYKYWTGENYLGLGPFAYSYMENTRFFINSDIQNFEKAENIQNVIEIEERLTEKDKLFEYIMLRLRLKEGISLSYIEKSSPTKAKPLLEKCKKLQTEGLGILEEDRFYLTPQGFLLSNSVINYLEIN